MTQGTSRAIIAAAIGNALEWYDFILYGYFAATIGRVFFPSHDPLTSLLLAVATFGVGFVLRPVGAIVLGQYADRHGRRTALTLIIAMMTVATALIIATPGYATIGIAAPLLVVLARLLQGFSVGGELGSSTAFLIESAPPRLRGLFASIQGASQNVSAVLAALAGTAITEWLTPDQVQHWGWRLPFLGGLLIGPVGFYIRRHLAETEAFLAASRAPAAEAPWRALARTHWRQLLAVIGAICFGTCCTYVLTLNMPGYANTVLHVPMQATFLAGLVASAQGIVVNPLAGRLSDRIGRVRVMVPTALAVGALVYPGFRLLVAHPGLHTLLLVQVGLNILYSLYGGALYGFMADLFPAQIRSSGISLGYNISVLIFGASAPALVTWMIRASGNPLIPSFYVSAAALISVATVLAAARLPREPDLAYGGGLRRPGGLCPPGPPAGA
jgi:MFS transporter, MHS family, proline/betaine transporter